MAPVPMSVCCYLAPNPISSVIAGDRAVVPRPETALARPWHALPEAATCGADLQDAARADCGTGCTEAYIAPAQSRAVFAADLPMALTNIMAADQRPVCVAALETP